MLVPMKIDYALRFLVYLTMNKDKGLIKTTEISDIQKIPHKFLLRISNDLLKAGYVKSTRGPSGGHTLIKNSKEIIISEIIKLLDYTLSPVECLDDEDKCMHSASCSQRELWKDVENVLIQHLSSISVHDLSERQLDLDTSKVTFV